ncbi:Beta-mannanase/endoglucanase A precursor [Planctomycetes bacterium MalM25]|nr:Beta-mannanase/endoglucanase A precursor [Planctomycetes bacterium MalM25]
MILRAFRLLAFGALISVAELAAGQARVVFTVDATGPTTTISPHIYGVNGGLRPSGLRSIRVGGNRYSGYNWETNHSNAGSDYFHSSDLHLVKGLGPDTPPGEAIRPKMVEAAELGASLVVTVPMAGHVAADIKGNVLETETAPSPRWRAVEARKSSVYPGSELSLTPDESDGYVFTDELVNWVEQTRSPEQTVFYSLGNEPALWDGTHPRLYGTTNPTFAEIGRKSISHASAIKAIAPDALVLGGVTYGWGAMVNLGGAADFDRRVPAPRATPGLHFNRWLLKTLAAEENKRGRPLVEVLDFHWYPEARGGGVRVTFDGVLDNRPEVVAARLQAPRSLWDPSYTEASWITKASTRGEPIRLLRRVQSDIDELKPGAKMAITEYNYGGGNHISGALAQADVLGILGREGVFMAHWWPIERHGDRDFIRAGFEVFTDFDGRGGRFGEASLPTTNSDVEAASVYASQSASRPGEVILVALNKAPHPLEAEVRMTGRATYRAAEVFRLTDSEAALRRVGSLGMGRGNTLRYEMPPYSASTIRLTSAQEGAAE